MEIDDEPVWMLRVVDVASPCVKLNRAKLAECEIRLWRSYRDKRSAALFVRQIDGFNTFGKPRKRVALIKAVLHLARRTAQDRDRSAQQIRKQPIAHPRIVQRQV